MIKAGIVGGTGYTGVELLRLLARHPEVELAAITSRQEAGTPVSAMFPSLRGRVSLAFEHPDKAALKKCDVVFFATPNGVAMQQARTLFDSGVRSGTDVARALALGAHAALAGKAFLWSMGALGSEGPGHAIDLFIDELQSALGQVGAHSPAEARDVLERGVADGLTFPWGSIILFGIDKVVKYHMDAAFWTGTFV